jgi:hypothetical protein
VRACTRSTMRMGARLGGCVEARGCGPRVRYERSQDDPYAPYTPLLLCVVDLAHAARAAADARAAEAGVDDVPHARVLTSRECILKLGARGPDARGERGRGLRVARRAEETDVRAGPALRVRERVLASEQRQERGFRSASFYLVLTFIIPFVQVTLGDTPALSSPPCLGARPVRRSTSATRRTCSERVRYLAWGTCAASDVLPCMQRFAQRLRRA